MGGWPDRIACSGSNQQMTVSFDPLGVSTMKSGGFLCESLGYTFVMLRNQPEIPFRDYSHFPSL
jgi:hypothetical protein